MKNFTASNFWSTSKSLIMTKEKSEVIIFEGSFHWVFSLSKGSVFSLDKGSSLEIHDAIFYENASPQGGIGSISQNNA